MYQKKPKTLNSSDDTRTLKKIYKDEEINPDEHVITLVIEGSSLRRLPISRLYDETRFCDALQETIQLHQTFPVSIHSFEFLPKKTTDSLPEPTNAFDFTQMSLKFLNPFREIIKTNTFSNARTLRTSFKEKLKDAFRVFMGVPDCRRAPYFVWHHIGIFDLLTLPISLKF